MNASTHKPSVAEEVWVKAHRYSARAGASFWRRLLAIFLPLKKWIPIRRLVRSISALAEPAGRLCICPLPVKSARQAWDGLTVISANLWHDWPRYRRLSERLEDFAELVEEHRPDVILLQEVTRNRLLRADEWLAARLGMGYVYSRANGHQARLGFEEGVAVFSRYPLSEPSVAQLGTGRNPFVRRVALGVKVDTPSGPLLSISAHLGLFPWQNFHQLAHLRAWVGEIARGTPAVVGGDFNTHEASRQIAQAQQSWLDTFRHLHPAAEAATHELHWPWGGLLRRARLDYIFYQPGQPAWNILETRHITNPHRAHSDHHAVLTRLAPVQIQP